MKKLTFSIFAATLAFGANANVEPATASNSCAYDGLFFGLGVSAVDAGIKTETTAVKGASLDKDQNVIVDNNKTVIGTLSSDIGIDTNDHDTRFTGNAVLGYGKRIQEKAYIALEAGLDAGQNSNFCHIGMSPEGGKKYDVISKNNGLIPSAALRLGYIHPESKNMFYIKAGAAYSQAKTYYEDSYLGAYGSTNGGGVDLFDTIPYSGKCSKWTPIVALGFEKVTGKNFRTRAEVEYRFQTTRSFDFDNGEKWINGTRPAIATDPATDTAYKYNGTVKIYNKAAITLRVMGVYTVK